MIDLHMSSGATLNDRGQIVGGDGILGVAALWQHGKTVRLGTLPGMQYSEALGINGRGQVIGRSWRVSVDRGGWVEGIARSRAFLWKDGRMRALRMPGCDPISPNVINARGDIVGMCGGHVILWESDGVIHRVWGPVAVTAINERGQIIGAVDTKATDAWGDPLSHAVLWENGKMRDSAPWAGRPAPHLRSTSAARSSGQRPRRRGATRSCGKTER